MAFVDLDILDHSILAKMVEQLSAALNTKSTELTKVEECLSERNVAFDDMIGELVSSEQELRDSKSRLVEVTSECDQINQDREDAMSEAKYAKENAQMWQDKSYDQMNKISSLQKRIGDLAVTMPTQDIALTLLGFLWDEDSKIQAIKYYRAITGLEFKDAKKIMENWRDHVKPPPDEKSLASEHIDYLCELAKSMKFQHSARPLLGAVWDQGFKSEAIECYCTITGTSHDFAKTAMEFWREREGQQTGTLTVSDK